MRTIFVIALLAILFLGIGCVDNEDVQAPATAKVQEMVVDSPKQITVQQFNSNMDVYLDQYGKDATFELAKLPDGTTDCLMVLIFKDNMGIGTQDAAFYLKNYMDLHPEFMGYSMMMMAPTGNPATKNLVAVTYTPANTMLVVQDIVVFNDGTVLSTDTETYPEATYAKIADATVTGYFTDDDDEVIFS